MIKANELRIGNIVSTPNQNEFRIDLFDYVSNGMGKFGQIDNRDLHPLTWYLQDLKPIPLTEEWLVKFGLSKETIKTHGGEIDINLSSKTITICGSDSVTSGMIYVANCEYVHQLQNLYFALTGEELVIK